MLLSGYNISDMKNEYKKMSDWRFKHCAEVGRLMEENARNRGWSEQKCREMYLLGYLHDLGYEYTKEGEDHARIGGLLLKECGYKYWKEVYCHGHPDEIDFSDESLLLNDADMTVDAYGRRVGYDERLNDIGTRYGFDSFNYLESKRIVEILKKRH